MVTLVYIWAWWGCPTISKSAQSKHDWCSHVGLHLGNQQIRHRNTHSITSIIILWNATLLLYQLKQFPFKFKQCLRFIYYLPSVYGTRSGRHKHVFCIDTFRQTAFFLSTTLLGFSLITPGMFVTHQCLIAVIWVTVVCHDIYQSGLTKSTLNSMQLHGHT